MAPGLQTTPQQSFKKIDPVIATALLDAGLCKAQVADKLGVHPSSIGRFVEKYRDNKDLRPQTQIFVDNLDSIIAESMAQGLEAKERGLRYFNSLPWEDYCAKPDHIKIATINSGNVSWGVDYDKYRLQTGQSTSNVDLHAEFESLKQLRDAKLVLQSACSPTTQCDYHE